MKSTINKTDREELITRISALNEQNAAQWGKMNVYQMVKHCSQWEDMMLGKTQYKQSFIGRLFGKMALKDMMQDKPMKQNLPTVPSFKQTGSGDLEAAKTEWINLLRQHDGFDNPGFVHPFFGRITGEQAGIMSYKHIDHHLRQFGA